MIRILLMKTGKVCSVKSSKVNYMEIFLQDHLENFQEKTLLRLCFPQTNAGEVATSSKQKYFLFAFYSILCQRVSGKIRFSFWKEKKTRLTVSFGLFRVLFCHHLKNRFFRHLKPERNRSMVAQMAERVAEDCKICGSNPAWIQWDPVSKHNP